MQIDVKERKETYCTCRTGCHSKKCPCKAAYICCNHLCHPQHMCTNTPDVQHASTPIIDITNIPEESLPNNSIQWMQYGSVVLTSHHKKILRSKGQWLDDLIVTAAQNILKQQFPLIGGFQATVLGENLSMEMQKGEYVQILCISGNHWICISSIGCQQSTINVYDSLHGHLDAHTKKLVADLMQSKEKVIDVCYCDVQRQSGPNDCGLFAIAFATALCFGEDPTTLGFTQTTMRHHLFSCIQAGKMTQFTTRSTLRRPKPALKEKLAIYCICRLGDDGTEMVECSKCQEWFHLKCIHVPKQVLKNKDIPWQCSSCV